MGRAGIRRRKPKAELPSPENTDILADLEDQAAWSSYGSGIPRGNDLHRNAIWFRRGWRFYRNLSRRHNPMIENSGFWSAILVGGIGVAAFILLAYVILRIIGAFT